VTLTELNHLDAAAAQEALLKCCGSGRWARLMEDRRPFAAVADVIKAADEVAADLRPRDWHEAFAAHPRIGERSTSAWSQAEQAAALSAGEDTKQKLDRLNREYEAKFGFIFIVFASGKTPEEVLQIMETRMHNDKAVEFANAAAEQQQITRARILKLLDL
jgi:OHCU decarboxylase